MGTFHFPLPGPSIGHAGRRLDRGKVLRHPPFYVCHGGRRALPDRWRYDGFQSARSRDIQLHRSGGRLSAVGLAAVSFVRTKVLIDRSFVPASHTRRIRPPYPRSHSIPQRPGGAVSPWSWFRSVWYNAARPSMCLSPQRDPDDESYPACFGRFTPSGPDP